MAFLKEHHHKLLVVLFLIGALFIVGSFEARLPDSAIAASTPGSQSVQKNANWISNEGQPDNYDHVNMTQVAYTGEVRNKSTGALITSDTKLKPGDQVTLDIFASASYLTTGGWNGSPPAPWGADPASNLLPSGWTYRGNSYSFRGAQVFAYEYRNADYSWVLSNTPANYCSTIHILGGTSVGNLSFCLQTSVKTPALNLGTSGMNCGALASSDISEGQRIYSTTCTITTSGPQATLATNIDATQFYYPARVRELSFAAGTSDESHVSGYEPSDHDPSCLGLEDKNLKTFASASSKTKSVWFSILPQALAGSNNEPPSCEHRVGPPGISQFYSAGTIDAATLSWNIDVAPPPPTADIKANNSDGPIQINHNASATISWTSTNATSCSVSPAGWTGTSGSESTGNLTSGVSYVVNCVGPSGAASDSVTVNVGQAPITADIKANGSDGPITITYNTAANISWTSSHADSCSVSPTGWTGTSNAGISTGNLTSNNTYTLTCTKGANSKVDSVTVNVGVAPSPTLNFWGEPTTITQGQPTLLTWSSQNTTFCTASGGWSGAKAVNGAENVTPPSTITYTLACTGPGGTTPPADVTITVNPPPPVCPVGQTKPHPACSSGSCVSVDSCGISSCASDSFCKPGDGLTQCADGIDNDGDGKIDHTDSLLRGPATPDPGCSSVSDDDENDCPSGQTTPHSECSGTSCVSVASCGVSACSSSAQCAPAPNFSLSNSGNITATIVGSSQATSNNTTIRATPLNGFASDIILSIQSVIPPLPVGAQHIFADIGSADGDTSGLRITSDEYSTGSLYHVILPSSTTPGTYLITVLGQGDGLTSVTSLNLSVNVTSPQFKEVFKPLFNPWTKNEISTLSLPALSLLGF